MEVLNKDSRELVLVPGYQTPAYDYLARYFTSNTK